MMPTQTKEIQAVHVAELKGVLARYGTLQDFTDGKVKCQICSDTVTLKNAGSIMRIGENLTMTCNKTSCYLKIIESQQ